ncbi:cytochrome c family protein [Sulfitobacter sp. SK011]|uniref:c-type cytochrome n=1 Tax=Sulfitobacter sp. SK011 TaxID=1389004 RepID=UPI000E0B2FF5|nr:cytochrome c family protein [Sulfitobacter sp. SK011]AXI43771.1 cytochrome c family protein [Sulfitobacter sp. SK011]
MFDTMTITKVAAGLFGAWLILLLGKWAGSEMYQAEAHGEPSYVIEVADAGGDSAEAEVDFGELLAVADIAKGEKVFKKCSACHKVEKGANAVGPYLIGVVGRPVDAADGFSYSGALEKVADVWTPEHLNGFLANPKGYAPGTTMGFAGLKKIEERADVIAYLDSLDN